MTGFTYSPQGLTDSEISETGFVGDSYDMVVTESSSGTTYQWQKDNIDIDGATSQTFQISSLSLNDSGVYTCIMTNTSVPDLTLTRNNIDLTVLPSQHEALMALYNSTDGANWNDNTNWGGPLDLSDWHGITVDGNGNVTRIDLNSNNLLGIIPAEIGNLVYLQMLNLGQNDLSGTIPSELGNLLNLWLLDISGNSITGAIPTTLGNLSNLTHLYLYTNSLTGSIPAELGSLSDLQIIELGWNNLSGSIPQELGNLTNLTNLTLTTNNLSGALPVELGNLPTLDLLRVGQNQLEDVPDFSSASWLGSITEFSINNNLLGFDDILPNVGINGIQYSQQGLTDNEINSPVVSGTDYLLTVSESAPNTVYQWKRDGNDISGANSKDHTLFNFSAADEGVYSCEMTNPGVPGLTLTRNNITLAENDGVVGHYPFNANSMDESGYGNNGVIGGVILTQDRFGNDDAAYSFDGVDDYIEVSTTAELEFGTNDFSVFCWVYHIPNSFGLVPLVTKHNADPNSWILRLTESGGEYFLNFESDVDHTATTPITSSEWHFTGIIREGTDYTFYVDGVADGSFTATYNFTSTEPIRFGSQANEAEWFEGYLDDIKIYNRALGLQEVQDLFMEGGWPPNTDPTDILISNQTIAENQAIGSMVGGFNTVDDDIEDTHTYSLVSGPGADDNASFSIAGNLLFTEEIFDFETKSTYSIRVQTDDGNGGHYEKQFTITIVDENEDVNAVPTDIFLSNSSVDENQPIDTEIGILTTDDADTGDNHSYRFVSGFGDDHNTSFTISGDRLLTAEVFDYEIQSSYSVRIETNDGNGGTLARQFTITINDLADNNHAPTDISLSIMDFNENTTSFNATFSTTDEDIGDTHEYNLVDGEGDNENNFFMISGDQLMLEVSLNYEAQSSCSIRVRTDDGNGGIFEKPIVLSVLDVNEDPHNITLSSNAIMAHSGESTVGILNTQDPDGNESHTYSLVAGMGDNDNGLFNIIGNQLRTGGSIAGGDYSVRVRSSDKGQLTTEKYFEIQVVAAAIIPADIPQGTTADNYTIISIPMDEVSITDIFSNAAFGENGRFLVA